MTPKPAYRATPRVMELPEPRPRPEFAVQFKCRMTGEVVEFHYAPGRVG